jgi:flagellar hook protein FlgE
MLQAMFAGVSGLQSHQVRMNVIGNNIANVNTVGFKAGRISFQDQLSQTLRAAGGGTNNGVGGQNPVQVGLGVTLGAVDTLQTQGNLQTTGKSTDLAIQGGGFFMVTNGRTIQYTRDGNFDLDSNGSLVNPATGMKLLGYQADLYGVVDNTVPITAASALQVPVGTLTDAKQTENINFVGNLNAGAAVYSTKIDFTGNLDSSAVAPVTVSTITTVYDALGNAHTVETIFSNPEDNPTGANVPAGATRAWNVVLKVDSNTVYDSNAGKSRIYQTGSGWTFADASGNPLGSIIQLNGGTGMNQAAAVPGSSGAPAVNLNLNYASLTNNAASSSLSGLADGQTGSSPYWGTSIRVYDSLGVGHLVSFKYTRVPLQETPPPPLGATAQWAWVAYEGGKQIGSSSDPGNSPLFFGTNGRLVEGGEQTITMTPNDGSVSPFTVKLNNLRMTQLASDSNATAASQNGYPVGTLQSFTISPDGVITGVFSSGQSRALGQIAMTTFSNPSGLERLGNNLFRTSANSGEAQVGVPGQGGRGTITPGYLEMANVDLSTEFTNLIITERGFQANTRIISIVDGLLQDVINLKR